jgi:hypothetical protein
MEVTHFYVCPQQNRHPMRLGGHVHTVVPDWVGTGTGELRAHPAAWGGRFLPVDTQLKKYVVRDCARKQGPHTFTAFPVALSST